MMTNVIFLDNNRQIYLHLFQSSGKESLALGVTDVNHICSMYEERGNIMGVSYRLRILTILAFCAFLLTPTGENGTSFAKRGKKNKKEKNVAGLYEKGLYTDNEYNFSIETADGWKVKVYKKDQHLRLEANKKKYATPKYLTGGELLTTIPTIRVYVDTTSIGARAFVDSLHSKTFKSEQKKRIREELTIYDGRTKAIRVSRTRLPSGIKAIRCKIRRKYTIETGRGPRVDFLQGDMMFIKHNNLIFIFSGVCESLFYKGINAPLFQEMFDSITFPNE